MRFVGFSFDKSKLEEFNEVVSLLKAPEQNSLSSFATEPQTISHLPIVPHRSILSSSSLFYRPNGGKSRPSTSEEIQKVIDLLKSDGPVVREEESASISFKSC